MVSKNLQPPYYAQEDTMYCGPACIRMAREGYPSPYSSSPLPSPPWGYPDIQAYLYDSIHGNPLKGIIGLNSQDGTDQLQNWHSDPKGMTDCLQGLSNPPGVHWVQCVGGNRDQVMTEIIYWMNKRQFPTPAVANGGDHWVLITGFDAVPVPNSPDLDLKLIAYLDPQSPGSSSPGVIYTLRDASVFWYGQISQGKSAPWRGPVDRPGTWYNKYVAVLEPPQATGRVRVEPPKPNPKEKLLDPGQAQEQAKRWITEMNLAEWPQFSLLRRDDVGSFDPLLVLEGPSLVLTKPKSRRRSKISILPNFYYIVPYGIDTEFGERGGRVRLTRICVVVDAYDGRFLEISAPDRPMRYLPREEALEIAAAALPKEPKDLKDAETTLMFQPSTITQTPTRPFWRVKLDRRTMYVDQNGKLYGRLERDRPGK